jgi:hypothetical protein
MSVSIDTVYQRVLSILNKEQRGYVTPQEFNLFANQAQLDLFEQYFYDINQFGRIPGNDTEYSDMLDLLNKKIAIFETQEQLAYNTSNAYFETPANMYRLGTVIFTNVTTRDLYPSPTQPANFPVDNPVIHRQTLSEDIEAERINGNELLYINSSPLTKPKNIRPIYVSKKGNINVYGDQEITSDVKCNYIAKPAKVNWGYTVVNGKALYNAGTTVNFELHASEEVELVFKILQLAGISSRALDVYQLAGQEEMKNLQQEKA